MSEARALVGRTVAGAFRTVALAHAGRRNDVFLAERLNDGRSIVLKVPRETTLESAETLAREAAFLTSVTHPNVVSVVDVGADDDDDLAFLALESLTGETLAERIERDGPLDEDDAFAMFWQVLSALKALHAADIVHRDLRPRNVFLEERPGRRPVVRLIDFAAARFIKDHADADAEPPYPVGAHRYMAPEQHRGDPTGPWVDIYAVGAMLHGALAGELPEPGVRLRERRELSTSVDEVVMTAIADEPSARHASASDFQDALARAFLVG